MPIQRTIYGILLAALSFATSITSAQTLEDILQPGDSNRDLSFDTRDFVLVMEAAKYGSGDQANWSEGDWNGDGLFNSADLTIAWQTNNFEKGPYAIIATGTAPTPRGGAPALWMETADGNKRMFLFGGMDPITGDSHSFSPAKGWSEATHASNPLARCHHSLVKCGDGTGILFGGFTREFRLNDTQRYNPTTNLWTQIATTGNVPEPRCLHSSVWIPSTNELFVYGGIESGGFFTENYFLDTSLLNLTTNRWSRLDDSAPGGRAGAVAFYSSAEDAVFLWSGLHKRGTFANRFEDFFDGYTSDLWKFDPHTRTWEIVEVAGTTPIGREDPASFWIDDADELYVMLGYNKDVPGNLVGDSFRLNLAERRWEPLEITGPQPEPRWRPSVAYDNVNGEVWMYGGWKDFGNTMLSDTWRFDVQSQRWAQVHTIDE